MVVAVGLVSLVLPAFNAFVDKSLTINPIQIPGILGVFLLITLAIGLLAGSYPALYLSSFQAVQVFREKISRRSASGQMRKFLVVFQFCVSIILIIGTIIIYNQWSFLKQKDLGYNKENLVLVPIPNLEQYESLKNQLEQNPKISMVTASNKRLTNALSSNLGIKAENFEPDPKGRSSMKLVTVDPDFMKTLRGKLSWQVEIFQKSMAVTKRKPFILNEAAVEMVGWEEPIGKWFETSEYNDGTWVTRRGNVVGVVKNFNMESLYNQVEPVAYFISKTWLNWMTLRISNSVIRVKPSITSNKNGSQYGSEESFSYSFLDDQH